MIASVLVFLSYAREDTVAAHQIRLDMESAGCRVWIDKRVAPGEAWMREIESAIDRSDVFVALVSRAAYESYYVRAEQLRAKRKGKRIIPVILEDSDRSLVVEPLQAIKPEAIKSAIKCR